MKDHRVKMAVQILRDTQVCSSWKENKATSSVTIDSRDADRHREQVQQAVRNHFKALKKRFPKKELENVLFRIFEKENGDMKAKRDVYPQTKDTDLDPALMQVLVSWIEERAPSNDEAISVLEVVILFGFLMAFQAWCEHYNLPKELSEDALAEAKRWARQRAQELLKAIQAILLSIIVEIMKKVILENRSPEQIVHVLQEYLDGETFTKNMPDDLAASTVVKAFHAGAYHLNVLVGCTMKQWFVMDSGACGQCAKNAAMGMQDLVFEYAPGILTPPAHTHCRCNMIYFDVPKRRVEKLTNNTV